MRTIPSIRLIVVIAILSGMGGRVAQAKPKGAPPARHVLEGRHFRVLCHFEGRKAAREALVAAEAVWAPAVEVLGKAPELEDKIEIHLLRDPETYREVEQAITKGKFARNFAFSSWETRAAYVTVEPVYSDALLARIGLTMQTRRTIAHEAAHLVVYHAWPNYRKHPSWLSEGIAIWAADQAFVPGGTAKLLGSRPYAAQRIGRLRDQAEAGRLPPLRDVLAWDRYRDLGFHGRYAFWWGFFRHLYIGPRADAFRRVLDSIGAMPVGGSFRGALLTAMTKAFADEDGSFDTLHADLVDFAGSLETTWEETLRTLDIRGRTWWQLAFPDKNAVCWRRRSVGLTTYRIEGMLEIQPAGLQQMNVLIGRRKELGFLSVAYRVGVGVTILQYDAKQDTWSTLAFGKSEKIRAKRRHRFSVEVDGKMVRALLDGAEAVRAEGVAQPLEGAWGVGVQAGGAGAWTDIRLRTAR